MPGHELVDIVDEHGEYLFHTTRKEAIEKKLRFQSVHVVAFLADKVVLQRRSIKASYLPGWFASFASGVVLAGETKEQAIERECLEEVGHVYRNRFVCCFPYVDLGDLQPVFVSVFSTQITEIPPVASISVDGFRVFSAREFDSLKESSLIMPETLRVIKEVLTRS